MVSAKSAVWCLVTLLLQRAAAESTPGGSKVVELGRVGSDEGEGLGNLVGGRRASFASSGTFMVTAASSNRAGNDEALLARDLASSQKAKKSRSALQLGDTTTPSQMKDVGEEALGRHHPRRTPPATKPTPAPLPPSITKAKATGKTAGTTTKAVAQAQSASVAVASQLDVKAYSGTHCGVHSGLLAIDTVHMDKDKYTWVGCARNVNSKTDKSKGLNSHFYLKVNSANAEVTISMLFSPHNGTTDCANDPKLGVDGEKGPAIIIMKDDGSHRSHEKFAKDRFPNPRMQCQGELKSGACDMFLDIPLQKAGTCVNKCEQIPKAFEKRLTERWNKNGPWCKKKEAWCKKTTAVMKQVTHWINGVERTKCIFCGAKSSC